MKQAKGSLVVMVVKAIKSNTSKRREYNEMLSDKAKELLNRRILSGSWYPFEAYRECFDALCFVEARNNPKTLNKWGQAEGKRWLTGVYKATIFKGNLKMAVEQYSQLHKMLFNFGNTVADSVSDNEAVFTFNEFPRDWENFYHITAGWAQIYIGLSIDKKTDYSFINKSWEEEGWTIAKISWTP